MKVSTIVFAHAGEAALARRHLPLWRAHTDDLLLITPTDAPLALDGVRTIPHGLNVEFGEEALRRVIFGFQTALETPADIHVFLKADSFLISRPRARAGFQTNAHADQSAGEYTTRWSLDFPWIVDAGALRQLADKATLEPFESGHPDRWIAAQLARLELTSTCLQFSNEGFSRAPIRSWWECVRAVSLAAFGAYSFGGVRSTTLGDAILEAARSRRELASIVRSA